MDQFNYRSGSRILAIIDSVLSAIGFVFVIVLTIIVTVAGLRNQNSDENDESANTKTVLMWIFWGVLGVVSLFVAIHLYITIKFLKACKDGTNYVEAAKRARVYRNLNIAFLILSFFSFFSFSTARLVGFLIGLIFRGLVLYIVCNFIKELDEAIAKPISVKVEVN